MSGDNAPMSRQVIYPADYADAHRRHWEGAELLFKNSHWANADYLYGLSAECGLKAIMRKLGMKVDAKGRPEELRYRKHMPDLWSIFENFARRHSGATYLTMLENSALFKDWWIGNRYAKQSCFECANVAPHRDAADQVSKAVEHAKLDLMT